MFLKLKYILQKKKDYKVTDKEVEKAFLKLGYQPLNKKSMKKIILHIILFSTKQIYNLKTH